MKKRELCASRYPSSAAPLSVSWVLDVGKHLPSRRTQVCPFSAADGELCCFLKSTTKSESLCYPHLQDPNLLLCGRKYSLSSSKVSAIFTRRRRYVPVLEKLKTFSDLSADDANNIVIRVELSGVDARNSSYNTKDLVWYEFSDFSSHRFASSSRFLNELHAILMTYSSDLFRGKRVIFYNAMDAFGPILALLKGAVQMDVYIPQDMDAVNRVAGVLSKLSTIFEASCSGGGRLYDSQHDFPERSFDTVVALMSLHEILYCDESTPDAGENMVSYSTVIEKLARQTTTNLFLEFHPSELAEENYCLHCILPDVEKVESALREHFETFRLVGVVKYGTSAGTFFYLAKNPIQARLEQVIEQTIQGIIISPEDHTVYSMIAGVGVNVSIRGIMTGPTKPLLELLSYVELKATEVNTPGVIKKQQLPQLQKLIPRLFFGKRIINLNEGFSLVRQGNTFLFSYDVSCKESGDFLVTFQLLNDSHRRYKSQLDVPELLFQHSVSIRVV